MKRIIGFLCLALALCLCLGAFAEEIEEEAGVHVHDYGVSADASKVITWPGANGNGLIRFDCANKGEYQTEAEAQQDFQEYVVYPTDHNWPEDLDGALALKDTNRCLDYKAPTCEEAGYITIKCDHTEELTYDNEVTFKGWKGACNAPKTYTIPATGHTIMYDVLEEETCETGALLQEHCTVCNKTFNKIRTEAPGHVFEVVVKKEATCIADGYNVNKCKVCGHEEEIEDDEERIIPMDPIYGHHFAAWIKDEKSSVAPTCTEAGVLVERRLCDLCYIAKEVRETELDPLGHLRGKVVKRVDPTCVDDGYIQYDCDRCHVKTLTGIDVNGDPFRVVLEATPHANHPEKDTELISTVKPTCTEAGTNHYKCNACSEEWDEIYAPALGHDWKQTGHVDGKCAKEEADEVAESWTYTCKRCGATDEKVGTVPDHVWTEWHREIAYNQDGKDTPAYWIRQCSVCGKHQETIIPSDNNPEQYCAGNHTWGEYEVISEATCVEDGVERRTCEICKETEDRAIPAAGHTEDEGTVTKEATCTEAGEMTYKCTVCGETVDIVEIPATGHTEEIMPAVPATATSDGLTEGKKCSVCGEILVPQEVISQLCGTEHTWGEPEVIKAATCTEKGAQKLVCSVCGSIKEEQIDALGHTEDEGTVTKEATCTEAGEKTYKCTVCGETTKTEAIPAKGHTEDEGTVTKEATCVEAGEKTYKCTVCGETTKTEAIPATGHTEDEGTVTKEATCVEAGEKTYKCTVCGEVTKTEVIPATGKHTLVSIPAVPATKTETGLTEGWKCSVCGEIIIPQEVIDVLPEGKNGLSLDDDGTWRYYVDDVFDDTMVGIVDYEGGSFFVANGEMCSDANGLQEYPEGTWYFLANGQIQKQYTGLALYDGEWFYIVNGRLDNSLYGLVEYDGSQFLVNEGMILRSANGLWMDSDGQWYYLENGQVAFWFNGTTTYQGGTFTVKNGKLVP